MKYIKIKPLSFLIVALLLLSCEKDDICAETTPTTPQLIIRFYDNTAQEDTKTVTNIVAYGLDDASNPVELSNQFVATTDSLILPLRTDSNSTKLVLHKNYSIENEIILGNPDTITISYEREDIYVSRACGYKTIFNNISFVLTTDGDNWISGSEIAPNTNITNETSAHVKIYH